MKRKRRVYFGYVMIMVMAIYGFSSGDTAHGRQWLAPQRQQTQIYTTSITLPVHPVEAALVYQVNSVYNIPYARLDRQRYDPARIEQRSYTLVVLENNYLKLTLLPELGGRIYQAIFKPTGHNIFYQNPVLKPSPWGPPEMGWWLAVGGMEWGLPVEEHGYEWGIPWAYQIIDLPDGGRVELWDTTAADRLRARVAVTLPDDAAWFEVTPTIENPTPLSIDYKFWLNAMLAPGPANKLSSRLRLVMPTDRVTVHSTGDRRLPGAWTQAGWPMHNGVDWSLLANWREWYGFFQYPQAAGDFQAVYDEGYDEGVVRTYNSQQATGAKFFAFGYGPSALSPAYYTDDDSSYVEMHGGVAPTFADHQRLAAGATFSWTERWYPVAGLGGLTWANKQAALHLTSVGDAVRLQAATTRPVSNGRVLLLHRATNRILFEADNLTLAPDRVYRSPLLALTETNKEALAVLIYQEDTLLAAYQYNGTPPVFSTPTPTPTASATATPSPPPPATSTATVPPATATPSPSTTATNTPSATATTPPTPTPTLSPTPLSTWQGRVEREVFISGWASVARIWVRNQRPGILVRLSALDWNWQGVNYTGTKLEYGADALEFAPLAPGRYRVSVPAIESSFDVNLAPSRITEIVFEQTQPTPTATSSIPPTATPTASATTTPTPTTTSVATATATPPPTATSSPPPSPTATPTVTHTPEVTPTATVTATPGWLGYLESNQRVSSNWFAVIRVSVEGQRRHLVRLVYLPNGAPVWSATCLTGTKPEFGPYFCEFSPLIPGRYQITPEGIEASLTVEVAGGSVAVLRFEPD